jgi:hypothetical protein
MCSWCAGWEAFLNKNRVILCDKLGPELKQPDAAPSKQQQAKPVPDRLRPVLDGLLPGWHVTSNSTSHVQLIVGTASSMPEAQQLVADLEAVTSSKFYVCRTGKRVGQMLAIELKCRCACGGAVVALRSHRTHMQVQGWGPAHLTSSLCITVWLR